MMEQHITRVSEALAKSVYLATNAVERARRPLFSYLQDLVGTGITNNFYRATPKGIEYLQYVSSIKDLLVKALPVER
jgi:hypothetical protein